MEDFAKAALEASRRGLIDESEFRRWFTTYVNERQDDLVKILDGDDDVLRLCRVLVSALAFAKADYDSRHSPAPSNGPPTPPSSSSLKRRKDSETNGPKQVPSQSPLKDKGTLGSKAKKRKFNATVEDAPASD